MDGWVDGWMIFAAKTSTKKRKSEEFQFGAVAPRFPRAPPGLWSCNINITRARTYKQPLTWPCVRRAPTYSSCHASFSFEIKYKTLFSLMSVIAIIGEKFSSKTWFQAKDKMREIRVEHLPAVALTSEPLTVMSENNKLRAPEGKHTEVTFTHRVTGAFVSTGYCASINGVIQGCFFLKRAKNKKKIKTTTTGKYTTQRCFVVGRCVIIKHCNEKIHCWFSTMLLDKTHWHSGSVQVVVAVHGFLITQTVGLLLLL